MRNFLSGVFGGRKEKVGPERSVRDRVMWCVITGCHLLSLSKRAGGRIWVSVRGRCVA